MNIQTKDECAIIHDVMRGRCAKSMKMMVDLAHGFLGEILSEDSIAVDFTMGNGFDTLFLAKTAKQVYAFDTQKEALEVTKTKLEKNQLKNVTLILDGHENALQYLPRFDAGIFNLGYLPGSEHIITTKKETTMVAIKTALDLLKVSGRLVLVVYPGHDEGKKESEAIDVFAKALNAHDYHVASLKMENKKLSPYLIIIDKVH